VGRSLRDDPGTSCPRIVDEYGVRQDEDSEVGSVVCTSDGVQGAGHIVHGITGRQLGATEGEKEVFEVAGVGFGWSPIRVLPGLRRHGDSLPGGMGIRHSNG